MRFLKVLLISHSLYILRTGIWPLIDIESFMTVTGPKTDIWLVKTVGSLLIPVGLAMLSFVSRPSDKSLFILAGGISVAFIAIDTFYALREVISDIYLLDAILEALFLAGWIFCWLKFVVRKPRERETDFQN
jgi:hypothetical protein